MISFMEIKSTQESNGSFLNSFVSLLIKNVKKC